MDIQQLLLEKALRDAQSGPTMVEAAGGGALAGTTLGVLGGARSELPFRQTYASRDESFSDRYKRQSGNLKERGRRMAVNSLLGAITGGALGAGTKSMFLSGMPNQAANMLAKIQTTPDGQLTEADQLQLRAILRDIYSGQ